MNSIPLTRWLRSKQLPILLSFMLLSVTVMQSLHDQAHHDSLHTVVSCEYCVLSQGLDVAVLPQVISLTNNSVVDLAVASLFFFIPPRHFSQTRARAPPQTVLSFLIA